MRIILSRIAPENVAKYLVRNGWEDAGRLFDGRVLQFVSPTGDDGLLLPVDTNFSDYERGMMSALSIIAGYERITVKGLYNKLANPSCDLLRWRIADDTTNGGIISFNAMEDNIAYIKDILGATCLDILNPASYHSKLYTKEVSEQISSYRFGQTEIGSYILNVLCPLGYYQYQLFDPDEECMPLARRININLLGNIDRVQQSAEEGSQEMRDKVEQGRISVNFLSALTDLYEENKDSELTLSASWNRDIPLLVEPVSQVVLKPRCHDRVMATIEEFSPKKEQNVPAVFYGKITNIGAEAEVDNRTMVDIKIATIGENMRTVTVNATLNYNQYFQVVDSAFQTGADVKVSGIKTTTAKSIKLTDASIEIAQ